MMAAGAPYGAWLSACSHDDGYVKKRRLARVCRRVATMMMASGFGIKLKKRKMSYGL
jgi:hypothetical protein